MEKQIATALAERFEDYGIEVVQFSIKKMAIPKDILNKVENLAFQLRQKRINLQAEQEFAQQSLDSYQTKLAIQQKYGVTEPALTEHEKDLALQRYLIKTGRLTETKVDHSINLQAKAESVDKAVEKKADIVPEIKPKRNVFKHNLILISVLLALVCLTVIFTAETAGVGFIMLGVCIAIIGTIVAFNHEKLSDPKVEPDDLNTSMNKTDSSSTQSEE